MKEKRKEELGKKRDHIFSQGFPKEVLEINRKVEENFKGV